MLLHDGYKHINGDGDPDLALHRIFRCAIKRFDSQMLLDPFEEQLDLPTTLVKSGDDLCR